MEGPIGVAELRKPNTNPTIQLADIANLFLHGLRARSARWWIVLAALQALLSIWLIQVSQHNPSLTLLAVIVWGGAVICIEDQLDDLEMRPSNPSLVAGFLLLMIVTARSCLVLEKDGVVLLLPLLQGIALALLLRPFRQLPSLREPLVVLSLFPLQDLATKLLPDLWLSMLTAKLSQLFLLLFGLSASVAGRVVTLGTRGVEIQGSCNSVDLIAQLIAIAIVFSLAFPISSRSLRIAFIAAAPLLAIMVNAGRIALLAAVHASDLAYAERMFTFLHDEWGALIFAGIATVILGQGYMALIERELERRHG
jgi:exosortase/archaeosortase family protein